MLTRATLIRNAMIKGQQDKEQEAKQKTLVFSSDQQPAQKPRRFWRALG